MHHAYTEDEYKTLTLQVGFLVSHMLWILYPAQNFLTKRFIKNMRLT